MAPVFKAEKHVFRRTARTNQSEHEQKIDDRTERLNNAILTVVGIKTADLMQSRHTSVTERLFSGNSTSIKYLPGRPMTLPTPKLLCAMGLPAESLSSKNSSACSNLATCSSAFARSSAAALAASCIRAELVFRRFQKATLTPKPPLKPNRERF